MKALVVGYGSIGQRHARILELLGCTVSVISNRNVDFPTVYNKLIVGITNEQPDYIVVCNKTVEHYDTMIEIAQCGFPGIVLIEKPLFHSSLEIPENNCKGIFVAYNLRFHPLILTLKKLLEAETVISVQTYVGQYLPDWRQAVDYRQSYSAHKSSGGGVLRDLSHELDYLNWLFDGWLGVVAIGGKYSDLQINSDDVFNVMMVTRKCPIVNVQLNYLDRTIRRQIIINTNKHTFGVDLVAGTMTIDNIIETRNVDRDYTYIEEHSAIIKGDFTNLCTAEQGLEVLYLIKAAEESVFNRRWVYSE